MINKLPSIFILQNASIKEAMRVIDTSGLGIAFILGDRKKLIGLITDGDVRKAILRGVPIEAAVAKIMNRKPAIIQEASLKTDVAKLSLRKDIIPSGGSLKVPLIARNGSVKDLMLLYADENKNIILTKLLRETKPKTLGVKRVLIVGGAGYLGCVLSRKLLMGGYAVTLLDNLTYGDHGIKNILNHKRFHFIKGDCRNISDIIEAIKGVDAVIHLAAIVGDPACALNPQETIENNYLASIALAQSAKFNQINRFLFISSCSVYGASKTPLDRLTEDSPLNPVSLYAQTKIKSEEAILSMSDRNFSPTIFRFATLYGVSPRMRFDLAINLLTAKAIQERKITIFGGEQYRPFLEVSDAAGACVKWLETPLEKTARQVFNVGSNDQNFRIREIGELINRIVPRISIETKKQAGDPRDYNVSFDKFYHILKFQPKKSPQESVNEIADLFKKNLVRDYTEPQYHNHTFYSF